MKKLYYIAISPILFICFPTTSLSDEPASTTKIASPASPFERLSDASTSDQLANLFRAIQ